MVNISLSTDKSVPGLICRPVSYSDNIKKIIKSDESISGKFEVESNEILSDETVIFTIKVNTDDDYSMSQTIAISTRQPFIRGLPPDLFAELNFKDDNNNGILEALENATLFIKITNKGKGNAQDLKVNIEDNLIDNDLTIGKYSLKLLEPSKSVDISMLK